MMVIKTITDVFNVLALLIGCGFGLGIGMIIAVNFICLIKYASNRLTTALVNRFF